MAVLPVVAEVKDVFELFPGFDLGRDLQVFAVEPDQFEGVGVVGVADHAAAGELELVQVSAVLPRERSVDGFGELLEDVSRADDEHSSWRGITCDLTGAENNDIHVRAIARAS